MGLLDEAIREHLDLKRRRGADPTEVERLEREALGPVRRGQQESTEVMMDEPEGAAPPAYPEVEETEHEWVDEPLDEPVFDHQAGPEPEREAPRHHEIAEEWDAHEPLEFHDPLEREADDPLAHDTSELSPAEPLPAETPPAEAAHPPVETEHLPVEPPPSTPPEQAGHLGEETAEYDVEAEHFERPAGEDVLEETPEFLQDTPDHDRLWFEQKPPRDFDFDK